MQQAGATLRRDFGIDMTRPIDGHDIWLSIDDADCDSQRQSTMPQLTKMPRIGIRELECYNRQLFYWLMIRGGPCIFPPALALDHGVPTTLQTQN